GASRGRASAGLHLPVEHCGDDRVEHVCGYRAGVEGLQRHTPTMTDKRPDVKWSDQFGRGGPAATPEPSPGRLCRRNWTNDLCPGPRLAVFGGVAAALTNANSQVTVRRTGT